MKERTSQKIRSPHALVSISPRIRSPLRFAPRHKRAGNRSKVPVLGSHPQVFDSHLSALCPRPPVPNFDANAAIRFFDFEHHRTMTRLAVGKKKEGACQRHASIEGVSVDANPFRNPCSIALLPLSSETESVTESRSAVRGSRLRAPIEMRVPRWVRLHDFVF